MYFNITFVSICPWDWICIGFHFPLFAHKSSPIFSYLKGGAILICLWLRFLEIMTATVLMVNDFYRTVQWLCVASLEEDTCICDQMWPTVTRFPIPRWLWWSDWRSATPSTSWIMATSSSSPSSSQTLHPPRHLTGPPPLPALTGNCLTGIPDYHLHSMSHHTPLYWAVKSGA